MPACPVIISPSPVIILFWLAPQFFPQPALAYGGRNAFISWEKTIRNIEQVATRSLELCKYSHVAWWNRSPQIDQEREREKKEETRTWSLQFFCLGSIGIQHVCMHVMSNCNIFQYILPRFNWKIFYPIFFIFNFPISQNTKLYR